MVQGRDKNGASRVSSLTNKEPLVVVESGIDVMWEIIREDCCYGGDGVIGERETSLLCGGNQGIGKRSSCTQDRDISHSGGVA